MSEPVADRGRAAARSVLTFEPAVVAYPAGAGRRRHDREVRFMDPVVDGVALRSRVVDHGVVGTFCSDLADRAGSTAAGLLGAPGSHLLAPGRVELLVCQVCFDVGCGSLTVAVDVGDEEVVWSDPLWEDAGSEARPDERLGGTAFTFERGGYEAAVRAAALAVADLPAWREPPRPRR